MNQSEQILPIGADHAGYQLKSKIIEYLHHKGIMTNDKGTFSEERADYPDYGHAVADLVSKGIASRGILLCGSGNGIAMSANKHPHVRAAICWTQEITELARKHNDANILVLPARFISEEVAMACVDAFLNTAFEGGRHQGRIDKIDI